MSKQLTISQARNLTGKHEDTIRRLIKKTQKELPKDAEKYIKIINGAYTIDQDYLLARLQEQFPNDTASTPPADQTTTAPLPQINAYEKTIEILQEQLKQKDKQIDQLLERNREQNINVNQAQNLLLLNAPKQEPETIQSQPPAPDTKHQKKKKFLGLW